MTIPVPLVERRDASYSIVIGRGLLAELPRLLRDACPAARYAVISDSQVARLYGEALVARCHDAALPAQLFAFPAGECGKTGVDVPHGKNLLGAFHQPRLVAVDLEVLGSLPPVQLAAGMAEAVKHGVIADVDYFGFLETAAAAVLARDPAALERAVTRSIEIKAEVVTADEQEAGRRAILNFGHTVGHAVEAAAKFAVLHGEAVAIGMACEARLAEALAIATPGTAARVRRLLERFGLPLARPAAAPVDDLMQAMQLDKKARAGAVRFALPRAIGTMYGDAQGGWTVAAPAEMVRDALAAAH